MATTAIFHHAMTAGHTAAAQMATPLDSGTTAGTSGSGGSDGSGDSGGSATISANDFLTLLVTEMQNQDPTDQTDPNEYINQLVQVNSLEQLIDINQTLSTGLGQSTGTGSTSDGSSSSFPAGAAGAAASALQGDSSAAAGSPSPILGQKTGILPPGFQLAGTPQSSGSGAANSTSHGEPVPENAQSSWRSSRSHAAGNLAIPKASPAATRVAHALGGRTHAATINAAPVSTAN